MVKNDFDWDYKVLLHKENKTFTEVGESLGVTKNAISKRVKGNVVAFGFVEACEELGYDIEVRYIKRVPEVKDSIGFRGGKIPPNFDKISPYNIVEEIIQKITDKEKREQ